MKHLIRSFQEHKGERGCHFYDGNNCTFLNWRQVFQFIDEIPNDNGTCKFTEKLADTLANYNPDTEFLAVQQSGEQVSVELYSQAK
jgi:hypothetical protein